jgi:rubrerythrin
LRNLGLEIEVQLAENRIQICELAWWHNRCAVILKYLEGAMEEIVDVTLMQELLKKSEGVSAVEKLLSDFEAHEGAEEKIIDQYRRALKDVHDPATRFVMQLIISDEEKHRAVMHSLAATLKGSLNWTKPAGSLEGATDQPELNQKLATITQDFIELEKSGIREYRQLLKESSGYYHGLFNVLIEAMIRDSEKHVDLLEYLGKRLKAA